MKLKCKSFVSRKNTAMIWFDELIPITNSHILYTKGVYTFEHDCLMEDFDLDYVVVPVWHNEEDLDYGTFIEDVNEYLIVILREIGTAPYGKLLIEASVKKRLPASEIKILNYDDDPEFQFSSIAIIKNKKLKKVV